MEEEKSCHGMPWCVSAVSLVILVWLFFRYALAALLPLILAFIISSAVRPIARTVSKKSRASVKICGGVIITLSVFAIAYGIVCIGGVLIDEASSFIDSVTVDLESEDNVIRRTLDYIESLPERLPLFSHLKNAAPDAVYDELYDLLISSLRNAAERASTAAAGFAADFIMGLPGFVFSALVCVISLFYLTVDYDGVISGVKKLLPPRLKAKASVLYDTFTSALGGYVRAYLILLLLTFGELLLGFVILGVKYAFLLALVTALIDILPVLGVGCVLIPWALVLFINGNAVRGVGMLVLFGVMYVVRQVTEPRLVGRFMGIHPLLTLFSAYLGYRFFGFAGMFGAPIVLYVTKLAVRENTVDL